MVLLIIYFLINLLYAFFYSITQDKKNSSNLYLVHFLSDDPVKLVNFNKNKKYIVFKKREEDMLVILEFLIYLFPEHMHFLNLTMENF